MEYSHPVYEAPTRRQTDHSLPSTYQFWVVDALQCEYWFVNFLANVRVRGFWVFLAASMAKSAASAASTERVR